MNKLNEREYLLEEFISAINLVLPEHKVSEFAGRVMHLTMPLDEAYPTTNKYMIALYQILVQKQNGSAKAGMELFNKTQDVWGDLIIQGYENKISSNSLLETIVDYHKIGKNKDILIEPDGEGVRITMNKKCMYTTFCKYTGNRKCGRSPPLKNVVRKFHEEQYLFFLERPEETHSCVIRIKPHLEACDVLKEYQNKGKQITIL